MNCEPRLSSLVDDWADVGRVLIVRLDNLGDTLLMTPAIRAVARALPNARLTLLAGSAGAAVGGLNPDLNNVIEYEAPWVDPWSRLPHDPEREQAMIAQLKKERFDAALIFTSFRQSALPAAYLCYLAGIPLRAAASIDGPGSLLTTRHKHHEVIPPVHEVERALDLVRTLGIEPISDELDLVLDVPPTSRFHAEEWWRQGDGGGGDARRARVLVHPGCTMSARTYPWRRYADLIDALVERFDVQVALTGRRDEEPLVASIIERLAPGGRERARAFTDDPTLADLAGLVAAADVVVTNNTGPMHIAAAVKTPVAVLFALTNSPEQWGPWRVPHRLLFHDVPCRLCYQRVCPYQQECLTEVPLTEIVAAVGDLVALSAGRHQPELAAAGVSR